MVISLNLIVQVDSLWRILKKEALWFHSIFWQSRGTEAEVKLGRLDLESGKEVEIVETDY